MMVRSMDVRCSKNTFRRLSKVGPENKHVIEGNTETPHLTTQIRWIHVTFYVSAYLNIMAMHQVPE